MSAKSEIPAGVDVDQPTQLAEIVDIIAAAICPGTYSEARR